MTRSIVVAVASLAAAALLLVLLPGPPPPAPEPPELPPPAEPVAPEEVDMAWLPLLRERLASVAEAEPELETDEPEQAPVPVAVGPRRREPVADTAPPAAAPPAAEPPQQEVAAAELAPPPPPPEPTGPVATPLDRDQVKKAISWMKPEIAACFQKGLERDPDLSGTLVTRFTIEVEKQEGRLRDVSVLESQSDMPSRDVRICLLSVLADARFPVPDVALGRARVRYPFTMSKKAATPF